MMEVIFLCGVPGAGKTTFRRCLPDFRVFSYDDVIEARASRQSMTYNEVWESSIADATRYVDDLIRSAARIGENFIVDMTLLTRKSRSRKMNMIRDAARGRGHDVSFSIYYIDVAYDTMVARNIERANYGRSIPHAILARMYETRDLPQPDEGFVDIYHVSQEHGGIVMRHTQGSKSFG